MNEASLLDDDGFRVRGTAPSRIDAFVDAAFAFAVTLLVISIGHVPESVAELVQAMRGVPAFAASFFVIVRLWLMHRHWSRRYGLEDSYSTRLSLMLVFLMLVYVYPLRMIAELTLAALSRGTLVETAIQVTTVAELRTLYVVFGVGYALTSLIFYFMHRHALALADELDLSRAERIRTRTILLRLKLILAIAALSTILALTLPMGVTQTIPFDALPGLIYILIYVTAVVLRRRQGRLLAESGLPEQAR
ncbi:MAG: TMEM175 family protein [Rhodanobacteraceae bacterium]